MRRWLVVGLLLLAGCGAPAPAPGRADALGRLDAWPSLLAVLGGSLG